MYMCNERTSGGRTWYKTVLTTRQTGSDPFGHIVNALVFMHATRVRLPSVALVELRWLI